MSAPLPPPRFPVTLFLLCDSLTLDPQSLTDAWHDAVSTVGARLEWLAIAAHDAVHLERDRQLPAPNAVVAWCAATGRPLEPVPPEALDEFLRAVEELADLPAVLREDGGRLLDHAQVAASVSAIRQYFRGRASGVDLFP